MSYVTLPIRLPRTTDTQPFYSTKMIGLFLLLLLFSSCNSCNTSLSVEPLINKVVNSKVKLKCVAVGCTFLDIVSSLGTDLPKDEENDPCDEDDCIVSSTLKLTSKYNGSKVWCRAHNIGSNPVTSSKSLILLQVNLDPISDLQFNAPSRTFLWNRPPTLNGISVYYSIQLNYSNGTSIYNADIRVQSYTLHMNVDKCSPLTFAVVAKADSLVSNVTAWIGPSHVPSKPHLSEFTFDKTKIKNGNVSLLISYVEDMQCTGLYSTSGTLLCEYQSFITDTFHLKVTPVNQNDQRIVTLRTLSDGAVVLKGDENIVGKLNLENKAGSTTQQDFNITTFDTVSFTNYSDIDSQLCFKCGFLDGSTSLGCNVSLTKIDGNFKEYYEVKKVSDDDVIAIRCPVKSLPTGVYNVCVSDIDQYPTKYTRCAIVNSFVHLNKSINTCDQDNNGNSYVIHMIGTFFLGFCLSLGLLVCMFRHSLWRRMIAIWNKFYHKDEVAPVPPTTKHTASSRDCVIQFEYKDEERKPSIICLRLFKELNRFYPNTPDYKIENLEPSTDYAILLYIKDRVGEDEVITFKTKAEQRNQQQGADTNEDSAICTTSFPYEYGEQVSNTQISSQSQIEPGKPTTNINTDNMVFSQEKQSENDTSTYEDMNLDSLRSSPSLSDDGSKELEMK